MRTRMKILKAKPKRSEIFRKKVKKSEIFSPILVGHNGRNYKSLFILRAAIGIITVNFIDALTMQLCPLRSYKSEGFFPVSDSQLLQLERKIYSELSFYSLS